ncbi:MAG: putative 2OG-Fe(II) oxygenase, partial [Dongiaceae bacterium]
MFENTAIHELFPTPVWIVDLKREIHEPLNRRIIAQLQVMTDPRPQAMTLLPKMRKYNKFVGNEIAVDVMDGRLLLFSAWLPHGVPVNPDDQERISISFNIMFTGFTE